MIGYHYTSLENYFTICKEGLVPYAIVKPELLQHFPEGLQGVWLWSRDLVGDEHVGSILWQLMTKNSTRIVKLMVAYKPETLLCRNGVPIEILHDGNLGAFVFHQSAPAVLATTTILPQQILRLATYKLTDLFNLTDSLTD